ncbi:hypothetical protein J6A34_07650 [bacterium]|nr:hypothetical protein [bacterium]
MSAIIGIQVSNRIEEATKLQEILTRYGCLIKTRIGLHDMGEYKCLNYGIVLIQVVDKINEIYDELSKHWQIQIMKF